MRVGQTEASRLGLLEAFPLPRSLPKLSDPLSCPAPPTMAHFSWTCQVTASPAMQQGV